MPEPQAPTPATPTSATAAPATPPAAETPEQKKLRVRFQNQDVDLDEENAKKYAQIGLSAGNLDAKRAKFQEEQKQYENELKAGRMMFDLAQNQKDVFDRVRKVMNGAKLAEEAKPADDLDGETEEAPLTRRNGSHRLPPEVEAEFSALKQQVERTTRTLDQRDQDERLNRALDGQPIFRGNPEARELASRLVRSSLSNGEFETADQAATAYAATMARLAASELEAEKRAREAKVENAAPRTVAPSAAFPRMDPSESSYASLKSGKLAQSLKDRVRAAMNPNP